MNLFQWITLPLLTGLMAVELAALWRGRSRRTMGLFRCLAWLAAALAIAHPEWTTDAANLLGVHRGTDLVLYFFAMGFLGTTLYFYASQVRLRRELTEMVRHVAIREARRGSSSREGQS
jgi:hypothetical protein